MKMSFYQFRDSNDNDNTILRPSYLYTGHFYIWKDGLYIETGNAVGHVPLASS